MALNLSRNTKLFVSTVNGVTAANTAANTWEVPVLDGYTFSQAADSQTITLNEAGDAPVRGQKIFNTALTPAEVSIPTYVRPFYNTTHSALEQILWEGLVGPGPMNTYAKRGANDMEVNFKGSNQHELIKLFLFFQLDRTTYRINDVALNSAEVDFSIDGIASITWNGQGASINELPHNGSALDTTTWVATTNYTSAFAVHTGGVEAKFIKNKLSSITLKKATGTTSAIVYANFAGALDPAAAVGYNGLNTYEAVVTVNGVAQTLSIDSSGNYTHKPTLAVAGSTVSDALNELNYQLRDAIIYFDEGDVRIATSNSGSTATLAVVDDVTNPAFEGLASAAFVSLKDADNTTNYTGAVSGVGSVVTYNVPITGGSLTIENNITYLTPEELGKVNVPIGSFTGTRSITGSVTAYLNTGSTNTAGLLTDLAAATDTVTHEFEMKLSMGGGANTPRVDFIMNHAHLVIPSINVEDVLSTEISFTGLAEEIDAADELVVRYVSPTV